MSKRFTYLFAGLVAASAALPVSVAAQSVRINTSPTVIQKLRTHTNLRNAKVPTKAFLATTSRLKSPKRATTETFNVPYFEDFNSQEAFDNFTVIDANDDNKTWTWSSAFNDAQYHWNSSQAADDWLITPGINLHAGKSYLVSYKAHANTANYPERIEAKWGQGTTVADLVNEITPRTDVNEKGTFLTKEITPTADGVYNFGFHAISDEDEFYLHLDSISITELSEKGAPDSVTNLVATADPSAALKVSLSFNAPTKKIDGSALNVIDSVVIRKDGTTIKNFPSVTPGSAINFVDENANAGANRYAIVAVNDKGDGRPANVTVVAGPDIPASPEVTAHDNETNIKFTWPNAKGANGGVIIPSDVSYEIWSTRNDDDYGLMLSDSITTVKGVNEYTLNENTIEGEQDLKYWAFNAKNAAGASQYSVASVIVGAPYTVPFSNSFANGTVEDQFFGVLGSPQYPTWGVSTDKSADNDGGSAIFYNYLTYYGATLGSAAGEASLYTGKISLQGAQNPELIFSYNGSKSTNARLVAEVEHKDGTIDSLWTESFTGGANTWKTATVSLPASVADEPYVFIHFRGIANDANQQEIYVDNIHIADPYENDAEISIAAPTSVIRGQKANIVATVSNQGVDQLSGLEVKISVNDEIIKDTTLTQSLALFDQIEVPVTYKTSSLQSASSLNVKAEVINASDLDENNNTATANIELTQADVNAPTALQGTETTDSVKLSWTAPEESSETVTDDFESYTAWATSDVGDWTFINADGGIFGQLTDDDGIPNSETEAAFEVWRPGNLFFSGNGLDPHSGNKCLASIYKLNASGEEFINSDDWLISPELTGKAQTVSFWVNNFSGEDDYGAYGAETFQVLASSTDKNTASFTQIGDTLTQESATWTKISVELPAGTKYFAIRRISTAGQAMIFFIDDISFETGISASSYNIYIDGKLAGNTSSTSYNSKNDGGQHSYSVTAVYSNGSESAPVSIDFTANSIDDIHAQLNADKYDVYTIGGAQVKLGAKSLNGLTPGVYVINGKKVILK